MKKQVQVLEVEKELLTQMSLEKVSEIRSLSLKIDFNKKESPAYSYLGQLCQELVISINTPEEYHKVLNDLPLFAGEIVHKQYIEKFVASFRGNIKLMSQLIATLADYRKLQKQVIEACLIDNIKKVADLRLVLAYATNDSDLQLIIIKVMGPARLDSFIRSLDDLCLILEILSEDLVVTLGKALLQQFSLLFQTKKQLFDSLQFFTKNPRLQELFIETLCETQLAKLGGSGYKKAILKLFDDRQIYHEIVKKAFQRKPTRLNLFFRNLFLSEELAIDQQTRSPVPRLQI